MPGLPGSTPERDFQAFKTVFEDPAFKPDMVKIYPTLVIKGTKLPAFKPDMVKIYPTLVIKGTKLYELWKKGEYKPLSTLEAAELVAKVKETVPPWVRINRVQRDIPSNYISSGVVKGNLRQIAKKKMEEWGTRCRCIRCREAGHRSLEGIEADPGGIQIINQRYDASEGIEEFISVEDPMKDVLIGFVRLRIPSEVIHRPEISTSTGLIREIHVYGQMVPVGKSSSYAWQHQGIGELLMKRAETIAHQEYDMEKIVVMSALGAREYFMDLGYRRDGAYVSKFL
jgi:elongator complex protein 3